MFHFTLSIQHSPVISKVILSSEGFSTDVTREWSLVGVGSFVDQQVVRLGKLALTEATDKLLSATLCHFLAIAFVRYRMVLVTDMTRFATALNAAIAVLLVGFGG